MKFPFTDEQIIQLALQTAGLPEKANTVATITVDTNSHDTWNGHIVYSFTTPEGGTETRRLQCTFNINGDRSNAKMEAIVGVVGSDKRYHTTFQNGTNPLNDNVTIAGWQERPELIKWREKVLSTIPEKLTAMAQIIHEYSFLSLSNTQRTSKAEEYEKLRMSVVKQKNKEQSIDVSQKNLAVDKITEYMEPITQPNMYNMARPFIKQDRPAPATQHGDLINPEVELLMLKSSLPALANMVTFENVIQHTAPREKKDFESITSPQELLFYIIQTIADFIMDIQAEKAVGQGLKEAQNQLKDAFSNYQQIISANQENINVPKHDENIDYKSKGAEATSKIESFVSRLNKERQHGQSEERQP